MKDGIFCFGLQQNLTLQIQNFGKCWINVSGFMQSSLCCRHFVHFFKFQYFQNGAYLWKDWHKYIRESKFYRQSYTYHVRHLSNDFESNWNSACGCNCCFNLLCIFLYWELQAYVCAIQSNKPCSECIFCCHRSSAYFNLWFGLSPSAKKMLFL